MNNRISPFRRSKLPVALVALVLLVPLAGTASASAPAGQPQIADLIEHNSPAVVNIRTAIRTGAAEPQPFGGPETHPGMPEGMPFDEFFRHFFGQMPRGGPGIGREIVGQGSGFIISADGYVVTNDHVIDGATEITVLTNAGESYPATLVGRDSKTDIALLKIDADAALPYVNFGDSDAARAGDWVVAIGNPFGLGGTATAGIISARGRDLHAGPYDDFIQIDAPINRGNSGGPVFNTDGEVIGVNAMIYSPNGGSVGIGFAIPSAQVSAVVDQLRTNGMVARGWLGVQIQDVSTEIADSLGLSQNQGALVAQVESGSPADKAGLKPGDVILDFDGATIDGVRDLSRRVADTAVDTKVELGIWRDGRRDERDVRIARLEEEPVRVAAAETAEPGRLGLQLSPLTPDSRRRFGVRKDVEGALVVGVDPYGPAARQGLRPGDVISMVGQQPVSTPDEVRMQLDATKDRDHVLFRVERGGGSRFVAMKLA